ncbi:calcium-binding protein [Phenylobacterium sp.]|jgi:Ca2+-binding RTX toxin-like protein|uniref:calcium-binding protein n=1 Tax=Phenylobacterium sp. TaxID=1871053 RepID=UPI002F422963
MAHVQLFDGYSTDAFPEQELIGSRASELNSEGEILSWGNGFLLEVQGSGLIYQAPALIIGGTVTSIDAVTEFGRFSITGAQADGFTIGNAFTQNDGNIATAALLKGDDVIEVVDDVHSPAVPNADHTYLARGFDGNDLMKGGGSSDSLFGGNGDDTIQANTGDGNLLRGEDGDDSIVGAAGFDDINGNKGDDTIDGGSGGGDWLVGGQGDDLITGHHSGNILFGNLGNDTLHGGDGGEVVRGGQGDDVIVGGAGADFISGDRGNDTESGGAGADIFHGSQDAGVDRVLDFNQAEGDRVQLDPGTTFTLRQVGADTVVDMGGGNQMILVGVNLSTLKDGWIFEA